MRIRCGTCNKPVSTEVPNGTIIRAYVECPECIESDKLEKDLGRYNKKLSPESEGGEE